MVNPKSTGMNRNSCALQRDNSNVTEMNGARMTGDEQAQVPLTRHTEWLEAKEAAAYLKVRPRTLLLWTRQGKIKGYPLSGVKRRRWRYRREDLDAALITQQVLFSGPPSVLNEGG